MHKKLFILLLILLLLLSIFLINMIDIEQYSSISIFNSHSQTSSQPIEKELLRKGITVYPVAASVLGRFENKLYLDTPILSELDSESGQIESFPESKNIRFISVNEDYLVGVNQTSIQGYNRKTKELLWKHSYDDVMFHVALSPIEDKIIYFAPNDIIYKINVSTGKIRKHYWIFNGFDYDPRIHLSDEYMVYFGDDATYIFDKEQMILLKKIEPISNPFTDDEHIYYIQRMINEHDVNEQKTLIKKYSLSKDEVEVISEIPVYEILSFIGMGNQQELYLDLHLISDPGIAMIKDGKTTFKGMGYNGFAMETFPSKLVSSTGYYNGYLFYIFNQQNQFYYQSVSANQSDWYEWKVIDLNNSENPDEIKELFNAKMIDQYVYVQDEDKLFEINLKEVLK